MQLRKIAWVGTTKNDLSAFPESVKREIGFTLHLVQEGKKPKNVKPLKGLGNGVMEIISNYDKDTYRAVYALKLGDFIYVLHAFQKKSKSGHKTPKYEIDLVKQRLKAARRNCKK